MLPGELLRPHLRYLMHAANQVMFHQERFELLDGLSVVNYGKKGGKNCGFLKYR